MLLLKHKTSNVDLSDSNAKATHCLKTQVQCCKRLPLKLTGCAVRTTRSDVLVLISKSILLSDITREITTFWTFEVESI